MSVDRATLPVDVVLSAALKRRLVHPVGTSLFVRHRVSERIVNVEVLATVLVLNNMGGLCVSYVVGPLRAEKGVRAPSINRHVYLGSEVYETFSGCAEAGTPVLGSGATLRDPLDTHIRHCIEHHRSHFPSTFARKSVVQHRPQRRKGDAT